MAGAPGKAGGSETPSCPIFPWGEEGAKAHRRGCAGPRRVADHGTGAEEHSDLNGSVSAIFAPCTIKTYFSLHFAACYCELSPFRDGLEGGKAASMHFFSHPPFSF